MTSREADMELLADPLLNSNKLKTDNQAFRNQSRREENNTIFDSDEAGLGKMLMGVGLLQQNPLQECGIQDIGYYHR